MKMQRRSFLKTVGATLGGTLGLGTTKSLPKPVEPKFATGGVVDLKRFPVQTCADNFDKIRKPVVINIKTIDSKKLCRFMVRNKKEIVRIITGVRNEHPMLHKSNDTLGQIGF